MDNARPERAGDHVKIAADNRRPFLQSGRSRGFCRDMPGHIRRFDQMRQHRLRLAETIKFQQLPVVEIVRQPQQTAPRHVEISLTRSPVNLKVMKSLHRSTVPVRA